MESEIINMIGTGQRVYQMNEAVKASPSLRRQIDNLVKSGAFCVQIDPSFPTPQKYWIATYFTQCAA